MLLPNEEAYINFLLNSQKVPLNEIPTPDFQTIENIVPTVRELATSDKFVFFDVKINNQISSLTFN